MCDAKTADSQQYSRETIEVGKLLAGEHGDNLRSRAWVQRQRDHGMTESTIATLRFFAGINEGDWIE